MRCARSPDAAAQQRRSWLVLNKIDLVPAPKLLPLTAALTALAPFEQTFMVSAATGDGIERLAGCAGGGGAGGAASLSRR